MLAGCSLARLGYTNGETISYWWLHRYIGFEPAQKPIVRRDIDQLFEWHRRARLKEHVQLLERVRQRAQGTVTAASLLGDFREVRKEILLIAGHAVPELADLALSLEPQQIASIEAEFTETNTKFKKEYLRGSHDERQEFRYEKALEQAEYWFGDFSDEQQRQLREASDARPLDNELLYASRLKRQVELIALLKKINAEKPGREATMALLREQIAAVADSFGNRRHQAFFEASAEGTAQMMALVFRIATPSQKAHFTKTIQKWIDDFSQIAAA